MDFRETVVLDNNTYLVEGERSIIDSSFSHAFGIKRGFEFEVDSLEIYEAWDECGEDIKYSNSDKELIYNLTQILKDEFNES